ncbi:MAG: class II fructose-bisphosphatase [Kistimonas sp.]|nr:class II fructose-bisphosphatase [Kistimonas sp.]
MQKELAMEFVRVTTAAALAAHDWLGRGDKNKADAAAVQAMRKELDQCPMAGSVVIGEGEIDEAPMLAIGESVGTGQGEPVDIAVDPIEGTRMTAMGQGNALTVLAAAPGGSFLHAPDMYMEKLAAGPAARGVLDLDRPLTDNLHALADVLRKPLNQLTLVTLNRPRHAQAIEQARALGVRVFAPQDGDVAAALLACMPDQAVDLMYTIGGAPEGVIAAAAIRALQGEFQGRLVLRHHVKEDSEKTRLQSQEEQRRCQEMGIEPGQILPLDRLTSTDDIIFCATGITHGELLPGIRKQPECATTDTLLICGKARAMHSIHSSHLLDNSR